MNTPGTPKPTWRQRHGLWLVLVVVLIIFGVTLFLRW